MHNKRQQVLDKLAERCIEDLTNNLEPNIDMLRLYLEHSAEAAAGTTASEPTQEELSRYSLLHVRNTDQGTSEDSTTNPYHISLESLLSQQSPAR